MTERFRWTLRADARLPVLALGTALLAAIIVFVPMLGFRTWLATYLSDNDAFDFWIPQFTLLQFYLKNGIFSGMDYFTHNGAAEWFLRPNLTSYFPPYLLAAYLLPTVNLVYTAVLLMVFEAICAIASIYYTILLANRYLGLNRTLSIFVAIGYTFSWHYLMQIAYVPFSFIAWIMPAVIYYSIASAINPNLKSICAGAFATLCLITAGYIPLSLQALALSGLMVLFFLLNERWRWRGLRLLSVAGLRALVPVALGVLVVSPWLLAMSNYAKITIDPSFNNNVAYSAYDLAESPLSLPRLLTGSWQIPGSVYEFSPTVGIIYCLIIVLFLSLDRIKVASITTPLERRALWFCLAVYVVSVLMIYGSSSAVASLFYFFAPVASFSHLYQRYLPLAQLFLVISMAQMLRVILQLEAPRVERVWLVGMVLAALGIAFFGAQGMDIAGAKFSQELILELVYGVIFLVVLTSIRGNAVVWVAMLGMFLPALDRGYESATLPVLSPANYAGKYIPLDEGAALRLDAMLNTFRAQKEILKVVDVTPGVHGYIPENYPWFRVNNTALSWYSGYDWHVGVPLKFRQLNTMVMPSDNVLRFAPSPQWVAASGADVLLFDPNDPFISPDLLALIDRTRPPLAVPYPGGNYELAPLKQDHAPANPLADNGYFRLAAEGTIDKFVASKSGDFDIEVNSTTAGALQYQFWPTTRLQVWVNGEHVETFLNPEGIMSIPVDAGRSVVTIRYTNVLLTMFLWFYAIFMGVLAAIVLWTIARPVLAGWFPARRVAPTENLQSSD